jgi:hypothetical protein
MKQSMSRYARSYYLLNNLVSKANTLILSFFHSFIVSLFLTLLAEPTDSQAAVACMAQSSCPFDTVNALPLSSGVYTFTQVDGGVSSGTTWTWNTGTTPNYIVNGTHWCASNSGTYATKGTPSGGNNGYCWCKLLDIDGNACVGSWVFLYAISASGCSGGCAYDCVGNVQIISAFRAAVVSPNPQYEVLGTSSCPAGYTTIPSNVGTLSKNGFTDSKGAYNATCNWQ